MTNTLHDQLRALLGADAVLTAAADTAAFEIDHRKLYRGRALAVVLPRTVEQVSAVVRWCNEHRVGLVPQGGNTGYCGGATPDESGHQLVLSLRRLNRIRELDAENFSMTVEAGCVLAQIAAGGRGRRSLLSAEPGLGGQLPDRRQPRRPMPAVSTSCATA